MCCNIGMLWICGGGRGETDFADSQRDTTTNSWPDCLNLLNPFLPELVNHYSFANLRLLSQDGPLVWTREVLANKLLVTWKWMIFYELVCTALLISRSNV